MWQCAFQCLSPPVDGLDVSGRGKRAEGKRQQNIALLDSAEGEAHNAWRKNKTKTRARNTSLLSIYLSNAQTYTPLGVGKKEKEKTEDLVFLPFVTACVLSE